MQYILQTCIVLFITLVLCEHADDQVSVGRERYETLKRESTMPKFGPCWKEALVKLERGCTELTEDLQHRLALRFTNCFLLKVGKPTYECSIQDDFSGCVQHMTTDAYNTYIEFYTHTQNMCYFLQSQVWQEETETTIDRLADNSKYVAKQLENSSKLQSEVIEKQNLSLKNQEMFIRRGAELKEILEESTLSVHNMLAEFKDTTSEQRILIFEVFDRVRVLQSMVMGEFTGFYSLIFYSLSIIISYFLTSTQRTCAARFWLFVTMTLNIFLERFIAYVGVTQQLDDEGKILDEGSVVYGRLWVCRKVFTTVAIIVWLFVALTYQDLNKINNQLLEEIRKQNSDLKHLLQDSAQGVKSPDSATRQARQIYSKDKSRDLPSERRLHVSYRNNSSTGYETYSESSMSGDSSDSQLSDRTYVFDGERSDCESNCSFWTCISGRSSRVSTPSLRDEISDLRSATPLREMTPIPGVTIAAESMFNSSRLSDISNLSGPGRPRDSTRRSLPALTTVAPRYNLHSRKGDVPIYHNPVVETESAQDCKKLLKHYSGVSSRNGVKVMTTMGRQQQPVAGSACLSSEDD